MLPRGDYRFSCDINYHLECIDARRDVVVNHFSRSDSSTSLRSYHSLFVSLLGKLSASCKPYVINVKTLSHLRYGIGSSSMWFCELYSLLKPCYPDRNLSIFWYLNSETITKHKNMTCRTRSLPPVTLQTVTQLVAGYNLLALISFSFFFI